MHERPERVRNGVGDAPQRDGRDPIPLGLDRLGGGQQLVDGLGDLDAEIVEDVPAVEHHRAFDVHRHRDDLVVDGHAVHRGRGEAVGVVLLGGRSQVVVQRLVVSGGREQWAFPGRQRHVHVHLAALRLQVQLYTVAHLLLGEHLDLDVDTGVLTELVRDVGQGVAVRVAVQDDVQARVGVVAVSSASGQDHDRAESDRTQAQPSCRLRRLHDCVPLMWRTVRYGGFVLSCFTEPALSSALIGTVSASSPCRAGYAHANGRSPPATSPSPGHVLGSSTGCVPRWGRCADRTADLPRSR